MAKYKNNLKNEKFEVKNVAIYARKPKFIGEGESIYYQVEECKNYLRSNYENFSTMKIDIFAEEELNKKIIGPKLHKMIKGIERREYDFVVCYSFDKITRDIKYLVEIKNKLDSYGAIFLSIKENFKKKDEAKTIVASAFSEVKKE